MKECPICKGATFLIVDNNVVDCECLKRKTVVDVYRSAGIPLEFVDSTMEQFSRNTDADHDNLSQGDRERKIRAANAVASFVQQLPDVISGEKFTLKLPRDGAKDDSTVSGRNLALQGGNRSGKSLLASLIAKGSLKAAIRPHIIEWASVIDSCFDFEADWEYGQMMNLFSLKPLLILENVDSSYQPQTKPSRNDPGRVSPFAVRRLDLLFSHRKSGQRPTVFTTSDDPRTFLRMPYGPILRSILNETVVITLPSVPEEKIIKTIEERIF